MRILSFTPLAFVSLLIGLIVQQKPHTAQNDGPYVLCKGKQLFVNYILDDHGTRVVKKDSFLCTDRASIELKVATDIPDQFFKVKLKSSLEVEKAEHRDVKKQFIVSDIEGNFKVFRQLLQANNIIDKDYNWTFGHGHLVLTGDFFDRGEQVTEVLWLIYALEDKAKAAGGYVHFILGNHEIMNLSNDLRYVHPKYIQTAALMNEKYLALFGSQSELGQWLRTKNVMETIGGVLYIHAGVSADVNNLDLSAGKINKVVRPYYADTTYDYPDARTEMLYGDKGPFWYRGYYAGAKATSAQIDSTLELYNVKHIATGHTIIADTISVLYNGKVFNTDVHHAKGISEGLLIEDGKFYRATAQGEKFRIGY
jgi:Calcineurin-like phosphoesterase